jgi:hypothetical protein
MGDAVNTKTNHFKNVVTDESGRNIRNVGNIKNKFSLFMQRNNPNSKFTKNVNKNLNNSSSVSVDIFDEFVCNRSYFRIRSQQSNKNEEDKINLKRINEPKSNLLSFYDNKIRDAALVRTGMSFKNKKSRNKNIKILSRTANDYSIKDNFSITMSDNKKSFIKQSDWLHDLPQVVNDGLNKKYELHLKNKGKLYENLKNLFEKLIEDKNTLLNLNKKENELLNELKEVKNVRNKIIADKSVLSNELDYIMVFLK